MAEKRPGAKGYELEERLRAYFDHAGAYAIRGVPFRFAGDDISDVDVWLYERANAMSRRRTIVDSKNKQRPKAVERILWLRGLKEGIGVEAAIVATTDRRLSVRNFAAEIGISILDGEAIDRLISSAALDSASRISLEELYGSITQADGQEKSKDWKIRLERGKASLLTNLGFQSANENLSHARFFADISTYRRQPARSIAVRLFLISLANAAVSLDFAVKDWSFRSTEERFQGLLRGLAYGDDESKSTMSAIELALALVRQYAENGPAIAKQVDNRFRVHANEEHYSALAEFAARNTGKDVFFRISRELDQVAFSDLPSSFDELTVESRSYVGVILDLFQINRKKVDELFPLYPVRGDGEKGVKAPELPLNRAR